MKETLIRTEDVRILIGGMVSSYAILIEITDESILNITVFGQPTFFPEEDFEPWDIPEEFFTQPTIFADFLSESSLTGSATLGMHKIVEILTLELTYEQTDNIWRLINDVVNSNPNKEFAWPPFDGYAEYVWAIIDGKFYWSLYHHDIQNASRSEWLRPFGDYFDRELLFLMYQIREISPIRLFDN